MTKHIPVSYTHLDVYKRQEQEAKASKPQPLSYIEKGFFYGLSRFKRM